MKKLFEHKDYEISSLGMFCFGGFCAQDSNLYAQPASGCKLASQTVILPCTEVANLNGLVIPPISSRKPAMEELFFGYNKDFRYWCFLRRCERHYSFC